MAYKREIMQRTILVRGKNINCHIRQTGFSLIELSIVLIIIMSVLTLGMSALNSYMASSAYSGTKARQARIKDALVAYYGAHKRLPCPAWGNVDPTAVPDMRGVERKDPSTGVCIVDTTITPPIPPGFGVVPYATLGLGRDGAEDGWGNLMSYQVYVESSSNCVNNPPTTYTTDINWTNSNCFGAGKPGGLWVYDGGLHSGDPREERATYNTATSPATDSRAVVVIVSHGPNGFGAWTRQGTQNVLPLVSSCEEKMNADRAALGAGCVLPPTPTLPVPSPSFNTTFIVGERPGNDDVVSYLTADDVIQRLAKQGDILSATAQVNADLKVILDDVKGQIVALTSSTPPSPATFFLPPGISLDPWGRTYRIVSNIGSISTTGAVTLNLGATSAVCIYSYGPNGVNNTTTSSCVVTAGGDDIVLNLSVPALNTIFNNKGCSPSC